MSYLKSPKNKVYAGGTPEEMCTSRKKVKTATNLRAGVFVIKDTTDDEIKAAGADAKNVIGILTERNWTNPDWDPTTAPAAGDEVDIILFGLGAIVKARNGANMADGDLFGTSSTGRVKAARDNEATPAAGDAAKTVGRVLADSDGSSTETDALVVMC